MSPIVIFTTRWNSRVTESSRVAIGICVAEWMSTSGNVDFAGQRVLEIGPASGFLTFEMEKRGADVISVEVTDEHGWDFVPYPDCKIGRSVRPASDRDATVEEFLLVQSRRPAIQSQGVLWRCLQFACGARRIRHRRDGSSAAPLPRSASNR